MKRNNARSSKQQRRFSCFQLSFLKNLRIALNFFFKIKYFEKPNQNLSIKGFECRGLHTECSLSCCSSCRSDGLNTPNLLLTLHFRVTEPLQQLHTKHWSLFLTISRIIGREILITICSNKLHLHFHQWELFL